jgi:hypothetical protein
MSLNLLEQLRKNLDVPELKKVDPNTQEVKTNTDKEKEYRLMQAILPAVVAGVYDCARSAPGLEFLAGNSTSPDYISLLFGVNAPEVQKNMEVYTGNSADSIRTHFNSVAAEAVKILRDTATGADRQVSIRNTMGTQRKLFLPYLPAELRVGSLLNDEAMDDRMNKMGGPVSGFMHRVENVFGRESREEANKKRDAKM